MSNTIKTLNEGFMRKYMKEDINKALEKDVRNVLKRNGYDVTVEGADAYITAAAEFIDLGRSFGDTDSVEEWLKNTELNYPEDLAFMKVSVDECITEDVEKEVFHNDNGVDYDIIERSKSGQNALLNRGKQWIIAWNCPESNEGSWGQGHYFFDEKSAREIWEDKYLNESLEENDYFDFNSDIYNALSEVMFKYRDKNVDEVDLDKALNWFADRFFEFEFEESLKKCINRLNEAEMSDEDKHDSEILWNIYNKTQRRANAALTPEEKEVLKKYNLQRDSNYKDIRKLSSDPGQYYDGPVVNDKIKQQINNWRSNTRQSDINLADRVRKMNDRGGYGYRSDIRYVPYTSDIGTDDHREYKNPKTGRYERIKGKGLLDLERQDQNVRMAEPVINMKDAIRDRKYHGKNVADNNAKYDAEREKIQKEYEKRLADNEKSRKWSGEYHQSRLDSANSRIDKLLKRDTDK